MSESTQNQYEFKVGDRVRCINACGSNNWAITLNMEYTVTWVETSAEYSGFIKHRLLKVAESKEPDQMYFWSRFELIESKTKLCSRFKAGDRVRCIDDASIIMLGNGEEYDVIGVDLDEDEFNIGSEFDFVFIDFGVEELNQNRLRASRFELVVPEHDPPASADL